MTAIAARRKRRTWYAFAAGLLVIAAVPVLGVAGWRAIRDSKAARDVTTSAQTIPVTRTALLGATDADGVLTTVVVLALGPDGAGGSVVEVPVGAAVVGDDGSRERIADRFADGGLEQLTADVEATMLVNLDIAQVVDEAQLAALLGPVGDLEVELETDVVQGAVPPADDDVPPPDDENGDENADDESGDEDTGEDEGDEGNGDEPTTTSTAPPGEVVAEAGRQQLAPDRAAKVLLASTPGESEAERLPAHGAVWSAIATAVGDGRPGATPADPATPPADLTAFTSALWAGPVRTWQMAAAPITSSDLNPTGADLFQIDLAEAILVVASVAPSAASAVLDGASVQLTSGFADWHVTRNAIALLAYIGANVMVVITSDEPPPPTTEVLAGSTAVQALAAEYSEVLEGGDVGTVTAPVEGIEVQIVLGQSFADAQEGQTQVPLDSVPSRETIDENAETPPESASDTTVES